MMGMIKQLLFICFSSTYLKSSRLVLNSIKPLTFGFRYLLRFDGLASYWKDLLIICDIELTK